jgi:hypothetical protein
LAGGGGTFYAVEFSRYPANSVCPACGGRRIKRALDETDSANRTITSLRGVITRMKKGKA